MFKTLCKLLSINWSEEKSLPFSGQPLLFFYPGGWVKPPEAQGRGCCAVEMQKPALRCCSSVNWDHLSLPFPHTPHSLSHDPPPLYQRWHWSHDGQELEKTESSKVHRGHWLSGRFLFSFIMCLQEISFRVSVSLYFRSFEFSRIQASARWTALLERTVT